MMGMVISRVWNDHWEAGVVGIEAGVWMYIFVNRSLFYAFMVYCS